MLKHRSEICCLEIYAKWEIWKKSMLKSIRLYSSGWGHMTDFAPTTYLLSQCWLQQHQSYWSTVPSEIIRTTSFYGLTFLCVDIFPPIFQGFGTIWIPTFTNCYREYTVICTLVESRKVKMPRRKVAERCDTFGFKVSETYFSMVLSIILVELKFVKSFKKQN
jgi:hypothetical protein